MHINIITHIVLSFFSIIFLLYNHYHYIIVTSPVASGALQCAFFSGRRIRCGASGGEPLRRGGDHVVGHVCGDEVLAQIHQWRLGTITDMAMWIEYGVCATTTTGKMGCKENNKA